MLFIFSRSVWQYQSLDGVTLFTGAFLFTFQIYGDFSGYSDIAIGTARLFGIRLMRNFNTPYFSRDIAEFWRRWHISLTTWFRDYIYIPLGGNRCGKWITARNTLVIFLVSGFWHGANWTFILWGAYHALLFLPLFIFGWNRKHTDIVAHGSYLPSLRESAQMATTFLLVLIGWVIFRAEHIGQACNYLTCMITEFHPCLPVSGKKAILYIVILLIIEWIQREKEHSLQLMPGVLASQPRNKSLLRWGTYLLISLIVLLFAGTQAEFIYFQF